MTDALLETAARACHAAYRAERTGGKLHAPETCPCHAEHEYDSSGVCRRCHASIDDREGGGVCRACRPLLRPWDDLTEAARETFRNRARPAVEAVGFALETPAVTRIPSQSSRCTKIAFATKWAVHPFNATIPIRTGTYRNKPYR